MDLSAMIDKFNISSSIQKVAIIYIHMATEWALEMGLVQLMN